MPQEEITNALDSERIMKDFNRGILESVKVKSSYVMINA